MQITTPIRYELTPAQVEELADKMPSATKGQRKDVRHIVGEIGRMQPGEKLYIYDNSLEDATVFSLVKWAHVKGSMELQIIQQELPASVVRKFLAVKRIARSA